MKTKIIFVIPIIIIILMMVNPVSVRAETSINIILGTSAGQWPPSDPGRTRYLTTDGSGVQFICPDDPDQLLNFVLTNGVNSYNPYCGDPAIIIPAGIYSVFWYGESPYSQYYNTTITVYSSGVISISETPPAPTETPPAPTATDTPPTITIFPPTETPTMVIIGTPTETPITPSPTPTLPPDVLYLPSVYSQASILKMLAFIFIKILLLTMTETGEMNMLKRIHNIIVCCIFIAMDMLFYPYIAYTNDNYILPIIFMLYIIIRYYRDMVDFLVSLTT